MSVFSMTEIDLLKVLNEIVEDHSSKGLANLVPVFVIESDELGCYLDEFDYAVSYTDAIDFIESITMNQSEFYVGDWTVIFDFVKELWVFTKKLEYKNIIVDSHNRKLIVKEKLINKISNLDPRVFEKLLVYIFENIPESTNVFVQPQSYDGGFEFTAVVSDRITHVSEWLLIQAKQQKNAVSVGQVRELIGTLSVEGNKNRDRRYKGLMISSKPASPKAKEAARDAFQTIDFLTHSDIVDLMIDIKLGWSKEVLEFWALDENFWDDLEGED
jgi:hypothetical protein